MHYALCSSNLIGRNFFWTNQIARTCITHRITPAFGGYSIPHGVFLPRKKYLVPISSGYRRPRASPVIIPSGELFSSFQMDRPRLLSFAADRSRTFHFIIETPLDNWKWGSSSRLTFIELANML